MGQGGAGSLDNKWNALEIREGAGEWVQRKPREASLSWIGWNEPKSAGEGGVETER